MRSIGIDEINTIGIGETSFS